MTLLMLWGNQGAQAEDLVFRVEKSMSTPGFLC